MSSWADSSGATSVSIALSESVTVELVRLKNTCAVRVSRAPERSRASTVLANVGGSGSVAIASTSASCSAMPASKAGR